MSGRPRPAGRVPDATDDGVELRDGIDLEGCSYEELIEAMEAITTRMAAGDIGIEEVADLYEQVGRLHAEATSRLARVRERIEGLMAASGAVPPAGRTSPGIAEYRRASCRALSGGVGSVRAWTRLARHG